MKSTTANKEIQPMKDEIKEIIADFDDLYVWVNKDGEYVIAEANTLRNWKREEFIDWLEKTLSQLQLSSMQRMADEVEKVKIAPHLPEGMKPNLDEVVWNNAINKAIDRLKAQQLMEREK